MANPRRLLVAGNWKMNGSQEMVSQFLTDLQPVAGVELVLLPPAPYLSAVAESIGESATFGAQDVHFEGSGAYTGDVAAGMVADFGGQWSIVGHSERRQYHAETDEVVAAKLVAAQDAGLTAILCVGESLAQREAGQAQSLVAAQLGKVAEVAGADRLGRAVVAYEPIWAIGTGVTATPQQAEEMHGEIRATLRSLGANADQISILYGGSVNADNATTLFAGENIDGALVGGASLVSSSLMAIGQALADTKG